MSRADEQLRPCACRPIPLPPAQPLTQHELCALKVVKSRPLLSGLRTA
jgi:hypothetical protein